MNHNVKYIKDLLFKTLELAKLRSSDIKFDIEKVNLAKETEDVIKSQKLFLKDNKINIENKINDKIFVNADKLRLAELLNNLITNAVKYTPENGGKITIDAKLDGNYVTVSISDNGIGMTKEDIKRIFDEFYRADKSIKYKDSYGLGLSICKRIVEKHGGTIWVDSEGIGKGSTFYFTLNATKEK
jgi:two-component system sensor histidine kinase VicK